MLKSIACPLAGLVLIATASIGCLQPAHYSVGDPSGDLGVSGRDLSSTVGASPGGPKFRPDIQSDLDQLGCTASACHGANASPVITASPGSDAAWMVNFTNLHSDCTTLDCLGGGASSMLLTKPLVGSTAHAGTKPFASTSDPVYQRWLAWLEAGAPYDANVTALPDMSGGAPGTDMGGASDMKPTEFVTITFTTTGSPSSAGSPYAPKNVVAVWIENNGVFVKTASRWANTRRTKLVGWIGKAGNADVDAVSGATRPNYGALTATWDMSARAGLATPADGTYTIRMELADSNATATTQNNEGTFTFNRNGTASNQAGLANGGFTNVSIVYSGR